MSEIRVDTIISHAGNSAPDFPQGANLSGVTTASNIKVGSGITIDSSGIFAGIVTATTFSGNVSGDLTGTVQTAAQTNITSVGTLGSLTVSGNVNANGNIVGDNSTNISGVSSVTATTFYGSASGLTDQSGGLDNIDMWASQGNDSPISGTGVFTKMIMKSAANNCSDGWWYFSPKDMSNRPSSFPSSAGAGVSFYAVEASYSSNTACWPGKNLTCVEAVAGIATFPSTGLWQIDWHILQCTCAGGLLQFGIECTSNIGAGTTVWGGLYPNMWNFCKISNPMYCCTGNSCTSLSSISNIDSPDTDKNTRDITAFVSVANTNQTGVRFSWGRDNYNNWIMPLDTCWIYKKVSNTAPW